MRKLLYSLGLSAFVLFAGCSNDANENELGENINAEQNNQEEIIEENVTGENNEQNNEQEEPEQPEEKTVTATYEVNQETWSITPLDDANEEVVLLTIDDAPDGHALEMAETLQALEANAIFFVNGHFLETEEQKEIIKEIYDMGFIIGNHTYSHPLLPDLSEEEQREEIIKVSDMVEEIIGERPKFFRAPHGENTDFTKELAKEEGMVLMNWSYGYDYFEPYMDQEKLTTAMITGEGPEVGVSYSLLKPGANLLMHDREWTAAALHDIVIGLREKGYEIVDPHLIKTD
ncbi:MAG TPA: polysaccharide deacetylase family protein [Candidatus Dormibacteraeota bacterium]|nr:polysaccharide deacetylase family protein [Candidatus Dormibacteraeota bacterium]